MKSGWSGRCGLVFIAALCLSACATTAPQSQAVLRSPSSSLPFPRAMTIPNVPFIDQSAGQCGPAALAMAMRSHGLPAAIDDVVSKVITPGKNGSLQEDMISASRREGVMAVTLEGLPALLTEIAAGHPVIIFENLALTWYPQWHYALIFGYDLDREELLMHSGHTNGERVDMRIFERSWKLSDYWGLVVLPPGQIAVSADELANLRAAAGLEQVGRENEALVSYRSIRTRWPSSLGALIGLGNIYYKQKKFDSAVSYLTEAKRLHPDSTVVDHNLKVAQNAQQNASLGVH